MDDVIASAAHSARASRDTLRLRLWKARETDRRERRERPQPGETANPLPDLTRATRKVVPDTPVDADVRRIPRVRPGPPLAPHDLRVPPASHRCRRDVSHHPPVLPAHLPPSPERRDEPHLPLLPGVRGAAHRCRPARGLRDVQSSPPCRHRRPRRTAGLRQGVPPPDGEGDERLAGTVGEPLGRRAVQPRAPGDRPGHRGQESPTWWPTPSLRGW